MSEVPAPVQQPQWSGLTLMVGDFTHILPVYEDDRIHETRSGVDCECNPETSTQFGEHRHQPSRTVVYHRPLRSTNQ